MSHLTPEVGPGDHVLGPADAPVTLVEYGDYECPYCGQEYPILKEVLRRLGGQVRLVFRNFPITESHPHAAHAAAFAEAVAAIGRFWEAHDLLYEHQATLDDASLAGFARVIGLPRADLDDALNGRHDAKIRQDFIGGIRSGVNGTPTLFINGLRYDGPRDLASLLDVVQQVALRAA
ncbi:DsbA family protein [Ancylobacter pratisalsi]|uniref:Thioredoxin domain-containing protein n=1 Tax=Ancylobacter pratisalsi TaxID=1745854 RepID=A0A6P1YQK6_9HYPH|nr:thioredoxin domain-containing protein [Ancylobacter pratisalsi]QIB35747.1 thioredoxin domain-containing protein [Ancylobacter pratisalsi]